MAEQKEEVVNYCPFKDEKGQQICTLADLDEHGMCEHVVGFCTIDPNAHGARKTLEPLEPATKKRKNPDTGLMEEIELDFLRVNGSKREYVQEQNGDILVNPLTPQMDYQSGQTHDHWLWFSWRVYNANPFDRVPELCPQPKQNVKARPKRKPEGGKKQKRGSPVGVQE